MEHQKLRLDELNHYHLNARRGNVAAIAESLRVNGQYKPIVVNKGTHTGRPNEVLVGNHTLDAAVSEGWEYIDAVTVDVDDDHARRIVLADNRTSDLGSYDADLLLEIVLDLASLEGSGFTEEDVQALEEAQRTHFDGPRDLDDLYAQVGSPTAEDAYQVVQITLPGHLADALMVALGDDVVVGMSELLEGVK